MSRLTGTFIFLALGEAAAAADRLHADKDVLEEQLLALCAWREHFNTGDIPEEYYSEDASLKVSLGPAGGEDAERQQLVDCEQMREHEPVLRGRGAVISFWNACVNLKDAYQDSAWSRVVVDDSTVLVKGKVGFAKNYGETLELWDNVGGHWQLRSTMLTIQEGHADAAGMGLAEELCADHKPEGSVDGAAPTGAAGATGATGALETKGEAREAVSLSGGGTSEGAGQSAHQKVETEQSGGHLFFILTVMIVCAGVGYMVHRSRRRRTAQIAGFESMLG